MANPALSADDRAELVAKLMQARRAVGMAKRKDDGEALGMARAAVNQAKRELGERGAVWWEDGMPDLNRHMVHTTTYADWFTGLPDRR